jgi:hypothetical protein
MEYISARQKETARRRAFSWAWYAIIADFDDLMLPAAKGFSGGI